MKYLLTGVTALLLLNSPVVMAQPNNPDRTEQRGNRDDLNRRDQDRGSTPRGQAARERARPTARDRTSPSGQAARERATPPARNVQDQDRVRDLRTNPNVRVATPRWSRGDRLPEQYRQNQYLVSDWQQRRLRPPPRGYRWVRDDYNNYYLMLIATGMIADIAYRDAFYPQWRGRYSRIYTYEDDIYYQQCRTSPDPAGVFVGALIGGLLGTAIGHGEEAGATIAGVIAGGALGAALTRNLDCNDRSYAYRTYYDGFNAGRPNALYQWRNPANGHYGDFRVRDYFYDPDGFHCANYTQEIFIDGRPQAASGRACQQPDGTWAIVG